MKASKLSSLCLFPGLARSLAFLFLCFFVYLQAAGATTCATVASGNWSSPSVWLSGIVPAAGDTAIIRASDSLQLDRSTAALGAISIAGGLDLTGDTLFLRGGANDTVVRISGVLDADTGWFVVVDSTRPIVLIAAGGVFRTAAIFPYPSPSIFDSSRAPRFLCDPGSTFEYYSRNLDLIDITYLTNNIIGGRYWNLTLTDMNASLRSNPLAVAGTLRIGFGSSLIPGSQQITIYGDVVNENQGESGAPGAGLRGCGMQSSSQDHWTFARAPAASGRDTCHWTGPSQVGYVTIEPNTVLNVRYDDDRHCDSLDILSSLTEVGMPCGGHLIGKSYSEFSAVLDSANPVNSFSGLGLTIKSGQTPYLGRTRVIRVSGYAPPNFDAGSLYHSGQAVLRYYAISTSAGPQNAVPNEMQMQLHCDELNGADPKALHFWRSRDQGATWSFSGLTSADLSSNVFTWDTTVLGWPNDSGTFYWTLAEGYNDIPLPVTLQSFTATTQRDNSVELEWKMASEVNALGYEVDRHGSTDSLVVASYLTNDALRATGAGAYRFEDHPQALGSIRYDLYEINEDGYRAWLASRVAAAPSAPDSLRTIYAPGSLAFFGNITGQVEASISDPAGRIFLKGSYLIDAGTTRFPLELPPGLYFVDCRWDGGRRVEKLLVPAAWGR